MPGGGVIGQVASRPGGERVVLPLCNQALGLAGAAHRPYCESGNCINESACFHMGIRICGLQFVSFLTRPGGLMLEGGGRSLTKHLIRVLWDCVYWSSIKIIPITHH